MRLFLIIPKQDRFESVSMELKGDEGQTFARFGAAIASIGDIDGNKFNDVAVGAPLETDSSGSIYIYNGFKHGLNFSQVRFSIYSLLFELYNISLLECLHYILLYEMYCDIYNILYCIH